MLFDVIRGGFSLQMAIGCILSSLAVIFLTLPIHEFAHGFVATKLGDPTPRYQGRMTLNPFAHIDYLGAACIILFGFGWAKPVQINPRYFKNAKWGMAVSALAGPFANIILAFISLLLHNVSVVIYSFVGGELIFAIIRYFFIYLAQLNVYLAVFNLIPIPPLDGSRILFAFLPEKYYFRFMRYERFIVIAVIILIYTGILSAPLSYATFGILNGLSKLANLPFSFI